MRFKFSFFLGLFLAGLVVIFTLQNTEAVTMRLIFWDLTLSRALLIFGVFLVGVVFGYVVRAATHRKKPAPDKEEAA